MYDSLNMHSLESSLIDIMRAEQDPMKGEIAFPFLSASVWGGAGDRVRCRGGLSDVVVQGRDRPVSLRAELFFPHTSLFSPPLRA